VKLRFTGQFEQAYEKLSRAEKESVQKALSLLEENPGYPSLHIKKLEGTRDIWEARPSRRLRMTFQMEGEMIIMRNVGEHDKVLKRP
jgi:mRNA interferase RelE/StbE